LLIIELFVAEISPDQARTGTSIYHRLGSQLKFCFQSGACPSITTPEKVTLVPHWIVNNVPQ
jgi:hypothetical protein